MTIKTKYNIGDRVLCKGYVYDYEMTINGIVIYSSKEIGYFQDYEENCIYENEIIRKVN